MIRNSLTSSRRFLCSWLWLTPVAALALTGCGGVGSTSSARIRSADAATNAGTSNVLVNGSASYGDQTYFSVSQYQYISTGSSQFSALVNSQTSTPETARTSSHSLSENRFYTAYLVGRPDVPLTDNRYVQIHVTDDTKPAIGAGQAAIRVLDAAPDAGEIDVLVNGSAPGSSFINLAFQDAKDTLLKAPYVLVSAGTVSVAANATGTTKAIIPATNVPVQAGKAYTILVTEPTAGTIVTSATGSGNGSPPAPPTYSFQTTSE